MQYFEQIKQGLTGEGPLKVILRGSIQDSAGGKVGVVSLVYATMDPERARDRMADLLDASADNRDYYMVYSVPLDTDLTAMGHYPSIAVTAEDLA